ncbi:hypothetical protein F2P56_030246 [Juglans regia]|uniref:Reverse transcriptase domain-containing protein n=1 Tax=Juglans regia TaxID=51240 RepID=A0A833TKR9_JUGRE|nr:hypothetical protein F2P56_030246 [Juglans regia]
MKILCWNSSGLGNPQGIRALRDLITREDPDLVFLQETKMRAQAMTTCKYKFGFVNCFFVDCVGRSGGLSLLWKREISVSISSFSRYHIDACIQESDLAEWRFTGVYGHPDASNRYLTWNLMRTLCPSTSGPWLVGGDFNEVLYLHEKRGGRPWPYAQLENFRAVMEDCALQDLGFQGPRFTWCNGRTGIQRISERLDRFFGNQQLWEVFPKERVRHGVITYSDHLPILFETGLPLIRGKHPKKFRFEVMWVGEEKCAQIIEREWGSARNSNNMEVVSKLIKGCGKKLAVWNKSSFGYVHEKLAEARRRLENLQQLDAICSNSERVNEARNEVNVWLEREELTRPYATKDVKLALDQMHPTKALGPDGMSALFCQSYWHIVGDCVTATVLDSLNTGMLPRDVNHTLISLIPKKNCAFVKGRLITDNVLLAYELVNYLRTKRYGQKGYMSLKLDMSKAYDKVEWVFLEKIMKKMGFANTFVDLIMTCVRTVSFSVLINGATHGPIIPSRELRQGNPLSPYLFLLCTEGLIALLKEAECEQLLRGIRVCRGAPMITHLLFADDGIIFCKADGETARHLQLVLEKYEVASGQKINRDKTAMVFSKNVEASKQRELLDLWGLRRYQQYDTYLGLLILLGDLKPKLLKVLKQEFGISFKVGKKNYSHKEGENSN